MSGVVALYTARIVSNDEPQRTARDSCDKFPRSPSRASRTIGRGFRAGQPGEIDGDFRIAPTASIVGDAEDAPLARYAPGR